MLFLEKVDNRFSILFLDDVGYFLGGGQVSLYELVSRLRFSEKLKVKAVLPEEGELAKKMQDDSIEVNLIPLPSWRLGNLFKVVVSIFLLLKFCKREKINLLYANGLRSCAYSVCVGKLLNLAVIWHVRVYESGGWREKILSHLVDKIIVNSQFVGSKFGYVKHKVIVVYNGVDTEYFSYDERLKEQVRNKWNVKGNEKVIGMVANFTRQKRQDLFLRAARGIYEGYKEVKFVLVGAILDEEWYQYLRKLSYELGISDKVLFLDWEAGIKDVYNGIDLLLHTAESEAFGRVIIEAMAMCIPVVAVASGAMQEIIENGVSGYLVLGNDIRKIAETVISLLEDRDKYLSVCKEARKKVIEKFNVNEKIQTIEKIIYNTICGKRM